MAPVTATYRYLRQWAADSLPPQPLVSHDTSPRHLRDPAFLIRRPQVWSYPIQKATMFCYAASGPEAFMRSLHVCVGCSSRRLSGRSGMCTVHCHVCCFVPSIHRLMAPIHGLQVPDRKAAVHAGAAPEQAHPDAWAQFHAWNKCLSHILALARAHIESVMYTHFIEGVNKCPDADCRKSLKVLVSPSPLEHLGALMDLITASRFKLHCSVATRAWSPAASICADRGTLGMPDDCCCKVWLRVTSVVQACHVR